MNEEYQTHPIYSTELLFLVGFSMSGTPLELVLSRSRDPEYKGDRWWSFCPCHDDGVKHGKRSLSFLERENTIAIKCWAGCVKEEILMAMDLQWRDLYEDDLVDLEVRYEICDANNHHVATHHRIKQENGAKRTWWSSPGKGNTLAGIRSVDLPLYNSQVISGLPDGETVVLTEGEKAAKSLMDLGVPAVGTVCGASTKPARKSLEILAGKKVVIWADNDEQGRAHMRQIAKELFEIVRELRIFRWNEAPPKGDAADHPATDGGDLDSLIDQLNQARRYFPKVRAITGPVSFGEYTEDLKKMLTNRRVSKGVTGIPMGLRDVDRNLHGFNNACSYLVAAATGSGKSLVVGEIALAAAMQNYRAQIFTLEQAPLQYLDRFAHYMSEVSYERSIDGLISEDEVLTVMEAANKIAELPLIIDNNARATASYIREQVERVEPDIVIIDYIQKVVPEGHFPSRTQALGQVSRDIQAIKTDFGVPLILAAQVNREYMSRDDPTPRVTDIRDSGELENDADAALILHNPSRFDPKEPKDIIEIHCKKNRWGKLWKSKARFVPEQNWLCDINPDRPMRKYSKVEQTVFDDIPT